MWGSLKLLNEGVKGLYEIVKDLSSQLSRTEDSTTCNLLPKLPLTSSEDLINLEDQIKENHKLKEQMIEKFRQFGGKGVGPSVRTCLKSLITDEVLATYSWAGLTNKKKFRDFKLILECLYSGILKNNANATQSDIKEHIKIWIKHSQERLNYKNKENGPKTNT